jgi:hypothetical protein
MEGAQDIMRLTQHSSEGGRPLDRQGHGDNPLQIKPAEP